MLTEEIRAALLAQQDLPYRAFQIKLLPTVPPETVIGVRTPALRRLARQLVTRPDLEDFLSSLPHAWFDENQLHAFLISELRDFDACMAEVCRFLPCVDNWATCDQLTPRCFRAHTSELLAQIRVWLQEPAPYSVRFAIRMLMNFYLGETFDPEYPALVASVRSDEYYVNMMIAWYFATALAAQYEAALPYLTGQKLSPWVHNKTIQKAVESDRIPADTKAYLRTLRRRAH